MTAERQRLELKLSKEQGKLMGTAEGCRQVSEAMALIFSDMARDAAELPPNLAGRTAVDIGIILSARIEKHRKEWADKFDAIGQ